MTAQKLDGSATLKAIKAELAERIAKLRERGVVPGLGTVLVGDDPGSHWYVSAKHKDCAEIGIESIRTRTWTGCTRSTWASWCWVRRAPCRAPRSAASSCSAGTASSSTAPRS